MRDPTHASCAEGGPPQGREAEILAAALEAYWASGLPVSSKTLSEGGPERPSPATIRHVLAELERADYLYQPHTSAGRVPTLRAIRWWLEQLQAPLVLPDGRASQLERELRDAGDEPAACLRASEFLAETTCQVGIVAVQPWQDPGLKYLRFFHLSEQRVLAILVGTDGQVRERVGRVPETYSQGELDAAANFFNRQFSGLTLARIRRELRRRLEEERAAYDDLLKRAVVLSHSGVLRMEDSGAVYFHGARHLAEVLEGAQLSQTLERLQQKERWLELLAGMEGGEASVQWEMPRERSGAEVWLRVRLGIDFDRMPERAGAGGERRPELSLISSGYRHGTVSGAVGVLGTTRMEYRRALSVVALVGDTLSRVWGGDRA